MTDIVITILLGLAMFVGLAATIIPAIAVLGIAGQAAEMVLSGMGARRGGASWLSTFGGLAAGVIGLFVFGPLGLIAGLLLGTFLLEFARHKNADEALKAMFGMGVGYGASFVVKFLLGLVMIAVWIAWVVMQ